MIDLVIEPVVLFNDDSYRVSVDFDVLFQKPELSAYKELGSCFCPVLVVGTGQQPALMVEAMTDTVAVPSFKLGLDVSWPFLPRGL
jgi:hypothetical protein